MPHNLSAKKRLRQAAKRLVLNRSLKREIHTRTKTFSTALEEKDLTKAQDIYKLVVSKIDKASKRNIFHKNKAARLKSKLMIRLNSVKA